MTSVRIRWLLKPHHLFTIAIYVIFILCLFMNVYVLLSRDDTIYYLRIYHVIVGGLMIACAIVMIEFLIRMRKLPKLDAPHEMPLPALIGAIVLTIGIVVGYLYFMIFNFAFSNCDKLVDALYGSEFYLDCIYSVLMILFCTLSLIYILQRRFYGSINTHLDKVTRLWINITFAVMWIKIVVYKGYLSHQELCQRQELEGYWCPVIKRHYECDPANDLKGTQKIWYYLNKGLLNGAVIACAAEFFPVLIIAHWLACGGAEEKAEDILRRKNRKQGVRSMLHQIMRDISRVYTETHNAQVAPLKPHNFTKVAFNILAFVTTVFMVARWVVFFYYSMNFDALIKKHWPWNDIVQLAANSVQFVLFLAAYLWARRISSDRLDAHHKAHARGDIIILFGCSVVLFLKLILQGVELEYQSSDGYIYRYEAILRTISLMLVQATQWLQYLAVRRLLALSDNDIQAGRRFLPTIAIAGVILSWIHFGSTFLDTSVIKYQLTDSKFMFHEITLVCMIFTQTIFPADYLYAFTASGCWLELIMRYIEAGYFQFGQPRLHHSPHEHQIEHGIGPRSALFAPAIAFVQRKEEGASRSGSSSNTANTAADESNTSSL